jgi:retron-type reverse transcriptase
MEHIIFSQVTKHLNNNNILVHYQHGFRSGHSCETQLLTTIEDISRTLDMRKQVDMILDFSKAFETVPHRRLLMKLDHYGIRDHTHEWIRQWLTTRRQSSSRWFKASSEVHVDSGVLQGTVLGPLIFLLYVNDIVNSEVKLFADDCLLYRTIESESDTKQLEWSKKWLMIQCQKMLCHETQTIKTEHRLY